LQCTGAFKQSRTAKRAHDLAFGLLNCVGKRTVTGMLTGSGQQFKDWSANYRLFYGNRMDTDHLFSIIRETLLKNHLPSQGPIYAHMDDTNIRKRGKKVSGTSWMRDPLGPPFHTNFIWGQRFIQLSVSLPDTCGASQSRAIPVDFHHCPTIRKPKKSDNQGIWDDYKEKKRKAKLSRVGSERIKRLRDNLDKSGVPDRSLILSVDGSYTNETVLKDLPDNTTLIGRIRKDCCLNKLPVAKAIKAGRKRVYGEQLPTPEQIRQSSDYPWCHVEAWAAGKKHQFKVKLLQRIRWRKAGKQNLQMIVIAPLGYRLTKKSKMLYRQPAYLICTDPKLDIKELLQAYLWRWEIEVNFRDEKTLVGCGQAQVRNEYAVEKLPAFTVAIYAMLLLAANQVKLNQNEAQLPRAKWYRSKTHQRRTTGDMLNTIRSQIWAENAHINFSHFVNLQHRMRSGKNIANPTLSAAFYMRN